MVAVGLLLLRLIISPNGFVLLARSDLCLPSMALNSSWSARGGGPQLVYSRSTFLPLSLSLPGSSAWASFISSSSRISDVHAFCAYRREFSGIPELINQSTVSPGFSPTGMALPPLALRMGFNFPSYWPRSPELWCNRWPPAFVVSSTPPNAQPAWLLPLTP